MGSPIVGVGLINAIIFGVYGNTLRALNNLRRNFEQEDEDYEFNPSYSDIFIAGALSGFVNCAIATPIELVKTRLQVQSDELKNLEKFYKENPTAKKIPIYKGPWDCFRRIYSSEGIRGIYKGNLATIYREVPSYGVYFVTYEYLRSAWGLSPLALFVAGGMGGVMAWVVRFDVQTLFFALIIFKLIL